MLVRSLALASLFASVLALAACGDPVENTPISEQDSVAPVTPAPVGEVDLPEELESDGNVPSLAQVQLALSQCVPDREVIEAQCEATEEGTEFACTYSLDGDTPQTEREAIIAADGETYVLIDIPEDCEAD